MSTRTGIGALVAMVVFMLVIAVGVVIGEPMGSDEAACPPGQANGASAPVPDSAHAHHTYDLGNVQPSAEALANLIGSHFDVEEIGGWRESDGYDEHVTGRALDFMVDRAKGDAISQYLHDHAAQIGVENIIWQQKIWSKERAGEGWRPQQDRGSPTANHMDHVHVFLSADAPVLDHLPGTEGAQSGADSAAAQLSASGEDGGPGGAGPVNSDEFASEPGRTHFEVAPSEPYHEGQGSAQANAFPVTDHVLRNVAAMMSVAEEIWPDDEQRRNRAVLIAVITTSVESQGRVTASPAVPESLQVPHVGELADHDSVGLYQQRVRQGYHGTAAQAMDPVWSTRMFFGAPPDDAPADADWGLQDYEAMHGVDWMADDPGQVAARIQRPAEQYRYRYGLWVEAAPQIIEAASGIKVDAGGLSTNGCNPGASASGAPGSVAENDTYGPFWNDTNGRADGVDPWNFYWGECVSYAAWHVRTQTEYKDFTNHWGGTKWGHAKEWAPAAEAAGVPIDTTPAVGSVAVRLSGTWGHVAVVTAVHPDGKIDVAEYNHGPRHTYGERQNLDWKNDGSFDKFIHFEVPPNEVKK